MPELFLNGSSIGSYKGVLFDKDGTLIKSEYHLKETAIARINETLKNLKNDLTTIEIEQLQTLLKSAYGLTSNGLNPHGSIAIASRKDNLISTATILCIFCKSWPKAYEMANKIFFNVDKQKNFIEKPLLAGAKNILIDFNNAGIKCAIVSNDTKTGIKDFLLTNNLENKFVQYWSCEDHPSKPNPDAIKNLCKIIQLKPSECLLIGDSDSDMQMAQKAGIGLAMGYVSGWDIKPQLSYQNKLLFNWQELSCHYKTKINF